MYITIPTCICYNMFRDLKHFILVPLQNKIVTIEEKRKNIQNNKKKIHSIFIFECFC